MKFKYFIIGICLFNSNIIPSNVQAANILTNIVQQNPYKIKGKPSVYFINTSGGFTKANMNFTLVEDSKGYLHIAYTNYYGVSYYSVQYSKIKGFKYTFYMNGWWYFN